MAALGVGSVGKHLLWVVLSCYYLTALNDSCWDKSFGAEDEQVRLLTEQEEMQAPLVHTTRFLLSVGLQAPAGEE